MKQRAGFTLLEMIVVLAIAALIIAIGAAGVQRVSEEHALTKVSLAVERVFMQGMRQAASTAQVQTVVFNDQAVVLNGNATAIPADTRLTLCRMGQDTFVPAAGQRVLLRPGGLCEPLIMHFQSSAGSVRATLDPLTGMLADTEEKL
ncbi:prepilin-type N-terminal cleavage/methylation domain-containing protein [Prosthecobacter sp.]|uniref:prepilin-type N-terminal cleavage/methylation domain-containing protein n=1 Tax=Prosthecobacter sp. TaxID=1965333 RepID=UPI002487FB38|nr:prepilin-type N-terminal cleavage/methylation domain-containing protein [Prosthecobacter sp.]MDI1314387.1 prepilin-type N-terminal cleavage/methylation domain-containing protein [Prosthecobacter sp.]